MNFSILISYARICFCCSLRVWSVAWREWKKSSGVSKKNSICLANPEEFNLKWCLELFPIMSREEDRSGAAGEMFMTSSTKDIKTNFLNSIWEKFLAMLLWCPEGNCFERSSLVQEPHGWEISTETVGCRRCESYCVIINVEEKKSFFLFHPQVTTRQPFLDEILQLLVIRQRYSDVYSILAFL